eukprot:gene8052-6359_t
MPVGERAARERMVLVDGQVRKHPRAGPWHAEARRATLQRQIKAAKEERASKRGNCGYNSERDTIEEI